MYGVVCQCYIHRHTGGLEILEKVQIGMTEIHRHTGGLENELKVWNEYFGIHRHTGGLEIIAFDYR